MGLDVHAFSHLRHLPTPEGNSVDGDDDDDNTIPIYSGNIYRLDERPAGAYVFTEHVHVWWQAEHGTFDIPRTEIATVEQRIEAVLKGSAKPTGKGDRAVRAKRCPITEIYHFRAGSYGQYGEWREHLCQLALARSVDDVFDDDGDHSDYDADGTRVHFTPFIELIYFSDVDGCIGPETSAKLAADFTSQQARLRRRVAKRITDADERAWFWSGYAAWQRAFEVAAQDGFVTLG